MRFKGKALAVIITKEASKIKLNASSTRLKPIYTEVHSEIE
jgi:hypothetical protein